MNSDRSLELNLLESDLDFMSSVAIEASSMEELEKLASVINASVNRGNAPANIQNQDQCQALIKEDVIIEAIGEDRAANKTYYATYRQLNDEDYSIGVLPKLTSSLTSLQSSLTSLQTSITSLQTKNPFCTLKPSTPWFKVSSFSKSASTPPSPQISPSKEVSLLKVNPLNQYSNQTKGQILNPIEDTSNPLQTGNLSKVHSNSGQELNKHYLHSSNNAKSFDNSANNLLAKFPTDDFDYIDEYVEEESISTYENVEQTKASASSVKVVKKLDRKIYYKKTDRASGTDFPYEQIYSKTKEPMQKEENVKTVLEDGGTSLTGEHQVKSNIVDEDCHTQQNNDISNTWMHAAVFHDENKSLEEEAAHSSLIDFIDTETIHPRIELIDTKVACFACDACTQTETLSKTEACYLM